MRPSVIISVVGGSHEYEFALLVDFIEEPPGADAVSPGGGIPVLEPLDVGTEMWLLSEAGIDRFPKLFMQAAEAGPEKGTGQYAVNTLELAGESPAPGAGSAPGKKVPDTSCDVSV